MLWASGALTVQEVRISQSKKKLAIDFIPQVNDRGEETTGFTIFSADNWGKKTLNYLASINKLDTEGMENIIVASRRFANIKSTSALGDNYSDDENDPRCQLVMGADSVDEEEEILEGGESEEVEIISGWGAIPKAFQDLPSSDNDAIEVEDTPAPKQKRKAKLLIPSDGVSSSTRNGKPSKLQKCLT